VIVSGRRGAAALEWRVRDRAVLLDRPVVLGILNVTPDSFSDGGKYDRLDAAVAHAGRLLADGADGIDVGGESTRPQGARPVAADEERSRVVPVVREIARRYPGALLTVDTTKSEVAEAAIGEGAHAINDVSALRLDVGVAYVCARARAGIVLMHSRGSVATMGTYADAQYGDDPVADVLGELEEQLGFAESAGIAASSIALDPGLGFSKQSATSLQLIAELARVAALGHPVLVGPSRKRFVGEITGEAAAAGRDAGSAGACVAALERGARIFRVHDVRTARHALDVAWAVMKVALPIHAP